LIANELSLIEKIGQMIIVGVDGTTVSPRLKKLILDYKIGGVILYRKNFSTYEEMKNLINEIKEINKANKVPMIFSIDQEGGRVNRMPKEIKNLPSVNKIANNLGVDGIKKSSKIIGEILKSAGFNMNFYPVLDIKRFGDKHAIGDRAFAEDEEGVSKFGTVAMKEMQKQKVISVVKHFPGHGATKKDSHFLLPIIFKSQSKLEKEDIVPFKECIKNGADAILVGHLLVSNKTGFKPASLSRKYIVKNLRLKNRYKGLIISDDLNMQAIKLMYGTKKAVEKAFKACNDIIIFRFSEKDEKDSIENIYECVKNKKIKEYRINKSVNRILKIKEKYDFFNEGKRKDIDIEKINKEIEYIREKCNLE